MASTFYQIPEGEMIDFLHDLGFEEVVTPYPERIFEKVEKKGHGMLITLFLTSLAKQSSTVRRKGSDAIRTYIMTLDLSGKRVPITSARKIYRLETWKKNARKALEENEKDVWFCYQCSSPMFYDKLKRKKICISEHK